MNPTSNTINFNGKTYNSLDEMPPDVRAQYETMTAVFADKNQNGVPDIMENLMGASSTILRAKTIMYDGKTYSNVNELPPEARAKYEAAMGKLADENHDGVPDVLENALKAAPMMVTTQYSAGTPQIKVQTSAPSNMGPIVVLAIVSVGLALVVGILLFLLLTKAGH